MLIDFMIKVIRDCFGFAGPGMPGPVFFMLFGNVFAFRKRFRNHFIFDAYNN